MVSWYSAKRAGLTNASQWPCAHAARQLKGAPRQKVALATTLVSNTTFTSASGGGYAERHRQRPLHPSVSTAADRFRCEATSGRGRASTGDVCEERSTRWRSRSRLHRQAG